MSRAERFQAAVNKTKQEQEERASEGGRSNFQFEEINYSAIQSPRKAGERTVKVYRFTGGPTVDREAPSDAKEILVSMVKDDRGKMFRCIWDVDRRNWFLWKIYNTVMACEWEDNTPRYYYKGTPLFNRVHLNDKQNPSQYETGWKPERRVMVNVIDRSMMDWHRENSKTVLIANSTWEVRNQPGRYGYEPGLKISGYEAIMNDIMAWGNHSDWNEFDTVLIRTKGKPYFQALDAKLEAQKIEGLGVSELVHDTVGLTDEEQSWERYDLDKLFKVTSARKIQNRLSTFVKQVDDYFSSNFTDELNYLVEEEKKLAEAEKEGTDNASQPTGAANAATAPAQPAPPSQPTPAVETPAPSTPAPSPAPAQEAAPAATAVAERPARAARKPAEATAGVDLDALAVAHPGINELTDEEKAQIVEERDGVLRFSDESEMAPCESCNHESPMSFHACPNCGVVFA